MFHSLTTVVLFLMASSVAVNGCGPGSSLAGSNTLHGKPGRPPPGTDGAYGPRGEPRSTAGFRRLISSSGTVGEIFSSLDRPDGFVTLEEWASSGGDPATYRQLLTIVDNNGDGKIALSEVRLARWQLSRLLLDEEPRLPPQPRPRKPLGHPGRDMERFPDELRPHAQY